MLGSNCVTVQNECVWKCVLKTNRKQTELWFRTSHTHTKRRKENNTKTRTKSAIEILFLNKTKQSVKLIDRLNCVFSCVFVCLFSTFVRRSINGLFALYIAFVFFSILLFFLTSFQVDEFVRFFFCFFAPRIIVCVSFLITLIVLYTVHCIVAHCVLTAFHLFISVCTKQRGATNLKSMLDLWYTAFAAIKRVRCLKMLFQFYQYSHHFLVLIIPFA